MSSLDFLVLIGSLLGIAGYGVWRTRGGHTLKTYLQGEKATGWATIGMSVMATQASAITFISTPGQGYQSGLDFVQNYFGLPLALILVAAVFLPMFRALNVYTAYEFLGRRFDAKTRLLGAGLFLLQRGLAAGITIYAPAIILSTVLGWRLDFTIVLSGLVVIVYTVSGGSDAVNLTQRLQLSVIFGGMIAAFIILLRRFPAQVTLPDALTLAGGFHKLTAVDFSFDVHRRYTFWSGLFGGLFLSLSYFGADQSQVQRYLSGRSVREGRLGLLCNAVLKIPMQFFILLLGVLLFVYYQFETPPIYFNQAAWKAAARSDADGQMRALESKFAALHAEKRQSIDAWLAARNQGDRGGEAAARQKAATAQEGSEALREQAGVLLAKHGAHKSNDADYVFIDFILQQLPHGVIGLLIAAFFAAALSSKAAELNALGSTTTVDFYRHLVRPEAADAHYVSASKWFTLLWGLVALGFALFAGLSENLIQAVNIIGSIFYGVPLALFLVAFFFRWVGGTAVFWAAIVAQSAVLALYLAGRYSRTLDISYLWFNFIGCAGCVCLSLGLESLRPKRARGLPALSEPSHPSERIDSA